MRYAIVENETVTSSFRSPKTVVVNSITYPADIFTKWTTEELEAIGIYKVVEVAQPDSHFYTLGSRTDTYSNGAVAESWGETEKTVADVKTELLDMLSDQRKQRLSDTDWYYIRNYDQGTAVPSAIQTARDDIRSKGDALEASVNACTTHAELVALDLSW